VCGFDVDTGADSGRSFAANDDAGTAADQTLPPPAAAGAALASDVLVSPHHGSAKSNSDAFLDAVSPGAVIVSAGWKNRFKFPHEKVIEKFRRRGYPVFRTDTDGAVFISTDGNELKIRTYLKRNH